MASVSLTPTLQALLIACVESGKSNNNLSSSSSSSSVLDDVNEFLTKLGTLKKLLGFFPAATMSSSTTAPQQQVVPLSPEERRQLHFIPLSLVRKVAKHHGVSMRALLSKPPAGRSSSTSAGDEETEGEDSDDALARSKTAGWLFDLKFVTNKGATIEQRVDVFADPPKAATAPLPSQGPLRAAGQSSAGVGKQPKTNSLRIVSPAPLHDTLTPEKIQMKRRVHQIEGLMEDLEYQAMVGSADVGGGSKKSSTGGKASVLATQAAKDALAQKHGHLFTNKGSKEKVLSSATTNSPSARSGGGGAGAGGGGESLSSFMKDMSIGVDMRLMSLAGAVVGYYMCWSRGQGQDQCIVGAAIGAVVMMMVDALLLMIRMSKEDNLIDDKKLKLENSNGEDAGKKKLKGSAALLAETTKPITFDLTKENPFDSKSKSLTNSSSPVAGASSSGSSELKQRGGKSKNNNNKKK